MHTSRQAPPLAVRRPHGATTRSHAHRCYKPATCEYKTKPSETEAPVALLAASRPCSSAPGHLLRQLVIDL